MNSPHQEEWKKAVQEELEAIFKNGAWEVVDIPEFINHLRKVDLGIASKCLGLHVEHVSDGIFLHQQSNIVDLLAKTGMKECRPVKTPMAGRSSPTADDEAPFLDTQLMRETIGSLLWLSNCTRPDITMAHGHQTHTSVKPAMYSDADWAGDQEDKSTSGDVLAINGAPISWYSKKQSTVALSTAKVQYIAAGTAVRDCLWIEHPEVRSSFHITP
ncbi:unnamed protein product [Phytophthora lilii]|uniref:Unnamed protein product n=1 Tax=Phytophthora lilii TaxID=2077276 RepID=A0A9W6WNT5_9STRA|nr:unnamed protein product [Phytophthora lilii]